MVGRHKNNEEVMNFTKDWKEKGGVGGKDKGVKMIINIVFIYEILKTMKIQN